MIKVGKELVAPEYFPDGTLNLKLATPVKFPSEYSNIPINVEWKFDNNEELIILMYLVYHLRDKGIIDINLIMNYLPNARMDRTKNSYEVFTLKYFCNIINSLNFKKVYISDAHSNVGVALLDRVVNSNPMDLIMMAYTDVTEIENERPSIFYPDEGAMKRYSDLIRTNCCFGIKNRDWETGRILGLDIQGNLDLIKDKNVLIIDDICSKGGTFYYSAKKLKELGAKNIYLYVTHCEDTIFKGELLTNENADLIKKIYTTDSLLTLRHDKIQIV